MVTSPAQIFKHYSQSYLPFDIIGGIPVALITFLVTFGTTNTRFVVFLKPLRTFRMARWFYNVKSQLSIWTVVRLMVYFFLAVHFTACLWYGWVGFHLLQESHDSWYAQQGVAWSDSARRKYIFSMYAGLMLMLGENINPLLEMEVVFAGLMLFIGAVIFATLVGNITLLVQQMSEESSHYNQAQHVLMQRLHKMHVPDLLKRRVIEYNKFAWDRYRGRDTNALLSGEPSEILLSRSLRTELALLAHAPVITRCPLFQDCEAAFIARVAMDLRVELASPGDTIYHVGDTLLKMFFLSFGEVALFVPKAEEGGKQRRNPDEAKANEEGDERHSEGEFGESGLQLELYASLGPGSYFGEVAMLYGTKTKCCAKAKTFAEMQYLDRGALKSALVDFKEEKDLLQKHVQNDLGHSVQRQSRSGVVKISRGKTIVHF